MTDEEFFALSDEEQEKAFQAAKAEEASPDTGIEEENQEVEELEQSVEQDSEDTTSLEEEVEDTEEEELPEENDELDGDIEESEDQPTEEVEATEADKQMTQEPKKTTFRADGQDYSFTDEEMRENYAKVFGQAMNYTKKTQALKGRKTTLDIVDQAGIKDEDLSLMADVLKGDKDALAEVLKRTGIDPLDLDPDESKYVPKDYTVNETEYAINEIVDSIKLDPQYPVTHNVIERQWDAKSKNSFAEDPTLITALHQDVVSGVFDTVNPLAQKLKVYDNGVKSDLEYYRMAGQQYYANIKEADSQTQEAADKIKEVKLKQAKQANIKKEAPKRKLAATSNKKVGTTQKDFLDDSDEAFEEWYEKLQEQY